MNETKKTTVLRWVDSASGCRFGFREALLSGFGILIVFVVGLGCSDDASGDRREGSEIRPHDSNTITSVFGPEAGSARLQQTFEHVLASYGGADLNSEGSLLWADPSEGNVKWFDSAGTLKMVIGRKGRGPGEFMSPYFPRFGPDGLIHVVDLSRGDISTFDSEGTFMDRTQRVGVAPIGGMALLHDGGYVVTGFSRQDNRSEVVHVLRRDGSLVRSLLPIRDVIPDGTEPHPLWDNLRTFYMAFEDPELHVTAALSDSVWTVNIATGSHVARVVRVPGRVPVSAPAEGTVQDVVGLVQWAGQHRYAYIPVVAGDNLVLSFMRGSLLDSLDVVQLIRDGQGSWWKLDDGSVVIAGRRNWLVGIAGNADSLRLVHYRRRADMSNAEEEAP